MGVLFDHKRRTADRELQRIPRTTIQVDLKNVNFKEFRCIRDVIKLGAGIYMAIKINA